MKTKGFGSIRKIKGLGAVGVLTLGIFGANVTANADEVETTVSDVTVATVTEDQLSVGRNEVATANEAVEVATNEVVSAENALNNATDDTALTEKVSEVEKELATLPTVEEATETVATETAKVEKAKEEVATATSTEASAKASVATAETKVEKAQASVSETETEISEVEKGTSKSTSEEAQAVKTAEETVKTAETKVSEKEATVKSAEDNVSKAESELKSAQEADANRSKAIEDAEKQIEADKSSVSSAERAVSDAEKALEEANSATITSSGLVSTPTFEYTLPQDFKDLFIKYYEEIKINGSADSAYAEELRKQLSAMSTKYYTTALNDSISKWAEGLTSDEDKEVVIKAGGTLNSVSAETWKKLTITVQSLVNSLRKQLGVEYVVNVSEGSLEMAKTISDGYVEDNWSGYTSGHDKRAIALVRSGWKQGVEENLTGYSNKHDRYDYTLADLKYELTRNILAMVLDDARVGQKMGHAISLMGIDTLYNEDAKFDQYIGVWGNTTTSSNILYELSDWSNGDRVVSGAISVKGAETVTKDTEKIAKAQAILDSAKKALASAEAKLVDSTFKLAELKSGASEVYSAQAKVDSAKSELSKAQGELTSAKNELASAQSALESAKKALENASGDVEVDQDKLAELKQSLTAKKAELANAIAELNVAKDELSKATANRFAKAEGLAEAEKAIDTAKAQLQRVSDLAEQLKSLKASIEAGDTKAIIEQLKADLEAKKAKLADAIVKRDEARNRYITLEGIYTSSDAEGVYDVVIPIEYKEVVADKPVVEEPVVETPVIVEPTPEPTSNKSSGVTSSKLPENGESTSPYMAFGLVAMMSAMGMASRKRKED